MRPRVEKKHLLLFNCGDYKTGDRRAVSRLLSGCRGRRAPCRGPGAAPLAEAAERRKGNRAGIGAALFFLAVTV